MDPRRLLTFRAVAHQRSFSKAAKAMNLTQPSVSHQIALLETEAGVRLLDRARGGLQLTPAGEVLLEHADHLAWRLALADTQIAELAAEGRRNVRLAAFPTALAGFVPAALAHLRDTDSDLRVVLSEVTPSTLDGRLLSGDFDIAVCYQDATAARHEIPGAERIDLLQDSFLVGLPPQHRLAQTRGPLALKELTDENWIFASPDGFLVQTCRDAGFEPRIVATTSEPLATRGLISRGLGVGWVPALLADDYDGIAIRAVREPVRQRDVYALLPPGRRHPRARDVTRALVETAQRFGAGPAGRRAPTA